MISPWLLVNKRCKESRSRINDSDGHHKHLPCSVGRVVAARVGAALRRRSALNAVRVIERASYAVADPVRHARLQRICVLLLATILGAVLGGALAWSPPRYEAEASILVTGVEAPGREPLYAVGKYTVDRSGTWAALAQSDTVTEAAAARLGEPSGALRDAVTAEAPTAQTVVDVVVEGPDADQALNRAEAVAAAAVAEINSREVPAGFATPRAVASVLSTPTEATDARLVGLRLAAVLGGVGGLLACWLVLALVQPGRWARYLTPPVPAGDQRSELGRLDQSVQLEVLGALLLGQSWRGVAVAAAALVGVFGYALTGSAIPPLAVVLLAGAAGRKDLRFAAGGILFAGASVFPGRIDVVKVGPITLTLLEIAVAIGLGLTLDRWRRRRGGPSGVFTGPVLGVIGALLVGCVVALAQGTDLTAVSIPARAILVLLSFFVFQEAFRDRPHQLFAILLVTAAAFSVIALLAVPLNLELLMAKAVDYVVTAGEAASVERLNTPVLELWSPMVVVLAAGVIRLRPRWLWAPLLVPCALLQALSFDRATWASLLVLAVAVAVLRGGRRGLLLRAAALVTVGGVALGALSAGLLGAEGQVVALRVASVVTGEALAEDSLTDRLQENRAAWATLHDSPVLGTGVAASYGAEIVSYDDAYDVVRSEPRPWIHNQYLRIWLWMGALGLLAYGAVVVRVLALAVRDWMRRGRAATLTVAAGAGLAAVGAQAVFATTLDRPSSAISVAVTLALMELAACSADGPSARERPAPRGDLVPGLVSSARQPVRG